jgi:predicted acylesterase/phospholipase RssA
MGIEVTKKKRIAFVCSGGAVKAAAFHTGVAMALERTGFSFVSGAASAGNGQAGASRSIGVYVGSSAGSLVTTYLAQSGSLRDIVAAFESEKSIQGIPGLKYGEMLSPRIRSPKDIFNPDNFLFGMIKNASVQSPFSTEGIAKYLRTHVVKSDRFSDLKANLFVVATELNQSRKVVFGKFKAAPQDSFLEYRNDVSITDACAASMSLPPVFHPYTLQIEGKARDFYDGEIREPLSEHVARDMGCDLIICSYTHQPIRLASARGSLAQKGVQQIVLQAIYQSIEQKIQSTRGARSREKALIDMVRRFFIDRELPLHMCDELVAMLEARMTHKSDVDYIYIHPRPSDSEMFLMPHFSLKRKHTEHIVKRGFFAGMSALRGL